VIERAILSFALERLAFSHQPPSLTSDWYFDCFTLQQVQIIIEQSKAFGLRDSFSKAVKFLCSRS
jgi:hypothetical protein